MFRNANPSNLRGSLREGNKEHLLNQATSDLAKQELHVESLNKCIGELQRQTEGQRLALQDAQYGFVEFRREQVRLQEDLSMKEQVLRNTQIRNMHEMGEIKRAQKQRIDEVSVQTSRENHETVQQLTSQLQQMQEQRNSTNDSGDFQDVESNYCIQSDDVQRNREAVHEAGRTKTGHTSEDRQNQGTIPMSTFATRALTTRPTIPVELPQNYMVGQQRQQISELQFHKFPQFTVILV